MWLPGGGAALLAAHGPAGAEHISGPTPSGVSLAAPNFHNVCLMRIMQQVGQSLRLPQLVPLLSPGLIFCCCMQGHMVPMDKPKNALDMITAFTKGSPLGASSATAGTSSGARLLPGATWTLRAAGRREGPAAMQAAAQ